MQLMSKQRTLPAALTKVINMRRSGRTFSINNMELYYILYIILQGDACKPFTRVPLNVESRAAVFSLDPHSKIHLKLCV